MNLFIDTEFNSFGGELMSIALVAKDFTDFYEELKLPEIIHPWVAENVVPLLHNTPITRILLQNRLERFLRNYNHVNIIADWPEDIRYFCDLLITGPGTRIQYPRMTLEIVKIDSHSEKPHHALYDAVGLRNAYMEN